MHDFIEQVGVDAFVGLVAIVGGLLIPLVAIIGGLMYKHRKLNLEAALKQQMIDRGISAAEIKEVLGATMRHGPGRHCARAGRSEDSIRCR